MMAQGILAMFGLPGGMEWVVILVIGLLLFGRRLPDVARSIGKSIVEFKRGMKDVRDDIEEASKDDRMEGPPQPARLEKNADANAAVSSKKKSTADIQ
ncbi:MAG: twin-arginine translocase TatA/TatE family subunit [Planctomycetota bacterium]